MPANFIILCAYLGIQLHSGTNLWLGRKTAPRIGWQTYQNSPQSPLMCQNKLQSSTDSESECGPNFEDQGAESEMETESDNEETALKEIRSDSELLEFTLRLQGAHDQMVTGKGKMGSQEKEGHLLGQFSQVKTEVEAGRKEDHWSQFSFSDKLLPEADEADGAKMPLRIPWRSE